ncbi:MAG: hypothetical protein ACJ8AD_10555 [Gemmatimonadaceae bacterium]
MLPDERSNADANTSATRDVDRQTTQTTQTETISTTTSFVAPDDDEPYDAVQHGTPATLRATIVLLAYLMAIVIVALYSLISFWPRPTPGGRTAPATADSANRNTRPPVRDSVGRVIGANAAVHAGATPVILASFQGAPARTPTNPATRPVADACGATRLDEQLWAPQAFGDNANPALDSLRSQMVAVCYLFKPRVIWKETQLVLLVIFAGALGGALHAIYKSTSKFFAGALVMEGILGLYTWPLAGAIVGLIFYVLVRGGFFSSQASVDQTSPYSFIALALLGGMFPHKANEKLTQVADLLLTALKKDRPPAPPTAPTSGGGPPTASTARAQNERGDLPAPPVDAASGPTADAQG